MCVCVCVCVDINAHTNTTLLEMFQTFLWNKRSQVLRFYSIGNPMAVKEEKTFERKYRITL